MTIEQVRNALIVMVLCTPVLMWLGFKFIDAVSAFLELEYHRLREYRLGKLISRLKK